MPSFVGGDVRFVLQGESDVVETIQQAVAHEVVDLKAGREAAIVIDLALLEVDGQLIAILLGAAHEFSHFVFGERDVEESVLRAVVGEDVGEGWGDHGSEPVIGQRPDGVFARGPAAEILAGDQNTGSFVSGMVENERPVRLAVGRAPPIVEKEFSKSCALNALQELLGDDLIGVDVDTIQGDCASLMFAKWLHPLCHPSVQLRCDH
jgi:hypothetical protein